MYTGVQRIANQFFVNLLLLEVKTVPGVIPDSAHGEFAGTSPLLAHNPPGKSRIAQDQSRPTNNDN